MNIKEIRHFLPKLTFFLILTALKQLILSTTGQRKRFQKSLGLYEVTEKSYGRITKTFRVFSKKVFVHNFFQWLPTGLRPIWNAFLGPIYPRKLVFRHIQALGNENFFDPKISGNSLSFFQISEGSTNDFRVKKKFFFLVPGYVPKRVSRLNLAQKSVWERFQSSGRSPKKVMVENKKISTFFGKIDILAFFSC